MLPLLIAIPAWSAAAASAPVEQVKVEAATDPYASSSESPFELVFQQSQGAIPKLPALAYPYLSLQGGISFADPLTGLDRTALQSPRFHFNTGSNAEVSIGYQFANHTRLEVSAGYLRARPSNLSLSSQGIPLADVDADGELALFTTTINGILEFPIKNRKGQLERLTPYIGAGIGYGNLSVPHCAISSSTCLLVNPVNTMAYQFKAGLSYRAATKTSLFLEGGYIGTLDTTFINENGEITYNRVGSLRLNLGLRQGF